MCYWPASLIEDGGLAGNLCVRLCLTGLLEEVRAWGCERSTSTPHTLPVSHTSLRIDPSGEGLSFGFTSSSSNFLGVLALEWRIHIVVVSMEMLKYHRALNGSNNSGRRMQQFLRAGLFHIFVRGSTSSVTGENICFHHKVHLVVLKPLIWSKLRAF